MAVKTKQLGKVVQQIGGFRIRTTKTGFGVYCGKRLYQDFPTRELAVDKALTLKHDLDIPNPGPYIQKRIDSFRKWQQTK